MIDTPEYATAPNWDEMPAEWDEDVDEQESSDVREQRRAMRKAFAEPEHPDEHTA